MKILVFFLFFTHSGKLRFFSRQVKTAWGLEATVTPQKLNSTAFVPSISVEMFCSFR